jgi:hypothetical protein
MKTEQEQIEQIEKVLKDSVADYKHLKKKGVCYCYAETLIDHGYGDVSEYKAEIERLKEETSNIRKETAKEILDMLYDMSIDKEILECCRIFDVNGVSLAKQICEKYGVEIEK